MDRNFYQDNNQFYDKWNRPVSPRQVLNIDPLQEPPIQGMPNTYTPERPLLKGSISFSDLISRPQEADMRSVGEMRPTGSIWNQDNPWNPQEHASNTPLSPPSDEYIQNVINHLNQSPEDLPSILEDYGSHDEMPPNFLQEAAHDYYTGIPLKPWSQYHQQSIPTMQVPQLQNPLLQAPMLGNLNKLIEQGRRSNWVKYVNPYGPQPEQNIYYDANGPAQGDF